MEKGFEVNLTLTLHFLGTDAPGINMNSRPAESRPKDNQEDGLPSVVTEFNALTIPSETQVRAECN